jgi:cutinase
MSSDQRQISTIIDGLIQGTTNSVGPGLCSGLKSLFKGEVACQGVSNPAYTAGLMDNIRPVGTSESAIAEATKHFNNVHTKCPDSVMVSGGFRFVKARESIYIC